MLLRGLLALSGLLVAGAHAAESALVLTGTVAAIDADDVVPTGSDAPYVDYSSTIVLTTSNTKTTTTTTGSGTDTMSAASTSGAESNGTTTSSSTSSDTRIVLTGAAKTSTTASSNANMTSTTTSAAATNTQPCNGWPEFCTRKYSNLTQVCAHNSPFTQSQNVAANQALDVTTQLNDGVRMVQAQAHLVNGTIYLCHSSCDLLNAGLLEDYLKTITKWVRANPYDVITILLGNARLDDESYPLVGNYVQPIQNSGIQPYLYEPPKIPMSLDDWPTLSEMILAQKRVVMMMDYNANQTEIPYIIDEFGQMWETPYDPTDDTFPCTVNRPPTLVANTTAARDKMYLANHNLNTELSILGTTILIPNLAMLNVTNGLNGSGSLGLSANQCTADWGRPPNFLNVDYYNYGSPMNGSVFAVAAAMNNVTYDKTCCGTSSSSAVLQIAAPNPALTTVFGLALAVALLL